jgi:hypothetical protein
VATPLPTPSVHVPVPPVNHPGVAVAVFLVALLGTSGVLWWRVRREYMRRFDETFRRLNPPEDEP